MGLPAIGDFAAIPAAASPAAAGPAAAAEAVARRRPSILGRRQAAGLLLALALLGAGRIVRQRLLVGPDGAWREELWLDGLVEEAAAGAAHRQAARADAVPEMPATPGATAVVADNSETAAGPADGSAAGAPPAGDGRPRKAAGKGPATPLDPNTAPTDSLQLLPGVGPVLAGRIVASRQGGNPFRRPEDLLAVKGIGPASLERLRPFLRFPQPGPEGPAAPARADNPH